MAREPRLAATLYQTLLVRLDAHGFDAGQLRKVVQLPEQVGQAGFQ